MSYPLQRCAAVLACLAALVTPTSISARSGRDTRSGRTVAVRPVRSAVQRADADACLEAERTHHGCTQTAQAVTTGTPASVQATVPEPHSQPADLAVRVGTGRVMPHPQAVAPPGPSALRAWLIRSALAPRAPPQSA